MAKTRDIKRRIRSIRNTMQLTRAMKMVSAAKLRRAQDRILNARPYALRMQRVLQSLALRANPQNHPLLQTHEGNRTEVVIVSADKGLCGSFNANIFRTARAFLEDNRDRELAISNIGKKGRDFFRRLTYDMRGEWIGMLRDVNYPLAAEIAAELMGRYLGSEVDEVYLAYNEFKSAIQQRPVVERVLPIPKADIEPGQVAEDYLYEPAARRLFDALLPHHVEVQVYRALLESVAAEHAARMTAMDAATNNAGELIESLTLTMNRVRQASITTEIIEVVSGAEALG